MEISIFTDKSQVPTGEGLANSLGGLYETWKSLRNFVFEKYPAATEEWNYPGAKYGWSFRIKDKKRAIVYLLPHDQFFQVAFVFGQKATTQVLASDIAPEIKNELENARPYAEGRGIRIKIMDPSKIEDVKKLIEIKLAN